MNVGTVGISAPNSKAKTEDRKGGTISHPLLVESNPFWITHSLISIRIASISLRRKWETVKMLSSRRLLNNSFLGPRSETCVGSM